VGLRRAWRVWRFKRRVRAFVKFYAVLESAISKNVPRERRKQFWRDLSNSDTFRKDFMEKLPHFLFKDLR